jgi:hypothetical protein
MAAHGRAVLSDPGTVPLPQARVDFSDHFQQQQQHLSERQLNILHILNICNLLKKCVI